MEINYRDLLYDYLDLEVLQYSNPCKKKYMSIGPEMYALSELYERLYDVSIRVELLSNNKYDNYVKKDDIDQYIPLNKHFFDYKNEIINITNKICNKYENNYLNEVPNNLYYLHFEKRLKEKEYYEILKEFLLEYNPKMLNTLDNLKNNNRISDYTHTTVPGSTYMLTQINKCYIAYNNDYTVRSIATLVHELSHAYQFEIGISKDKYYQDLSIYREFYSCFSEKKFIDYLIDNRIYIKDALMYEKAYLVLLYRYMHNLNVLEKKDVVDCEAIRVNLLYGYGCLVGVLLDIKDKDRFNDFINYYNLNDEDRIKLLGINNINNLDKVLVKSKNNLKRKY